MAVIDNVDQVNTHALAGLLAEIIKETETKPFVSDPLAYIARELTLFGVHYPGIYEDADEDADLLPEPDSGVVYNITNIANVFKDDDDEPGPQAPSDPASLAAPVPRPAPGTRPTVHGVPLTADPDEQSKEQLDAVREELLSQARESAKSNAIVITLDPTSYGDVLRNTELVTGKAGKDAA